MSVRELVAKMEKKLEDHGGQTIRDTTINKLAKMSLSSTSSPPSRCLADRNKENATRVEQEHSTIPPPVPTRSNARPFLVPKALQSRNSSAKDTPRKEMGVDSDCSNEAYGSRPSLESAMVRKSTSLIQINTRTTELLTQKVRRLQSQSSPPNQPHCRLFTLPDHIQTCIFKLSLAYARPIPIRRHRHIVIWESKTGGTDQPPVRVSAYQPQAFFHPPFLRTCKKIYGEATGLYYENNRFIVELETPQDLAIMVCWLYSISKECLGLVPRLILNFHPKTASQIETLTRTQVEDEDLFTHSGGVLAKAMLEAGLGAEKLWVVTPTLREAIYDGLLLGFDGGADVLGVRDTWAKQVCKGAAEVLVKESGGDANEVFAGILGRTRLNMGDIG